MRPKFVISVIVIGILIAYAIIVSAWWIEGNMNQQIQKIDLPMQEGR